MTADADPLILTLGFDDAAFQRLDALRRTHFPPALNFIPAHLTLFHHLPGEEVEAVSAEVARVAADAKAFGVRFTGLRKLGRGVAFDVVSPELSELRARLAARFSSNLTPQDRQGFRPHVTIQNKVDPKVAAGLFEQLAESFTPWTAKAEALLLWRYRGGPWESTGRFDFRPAA